VTVPVPVAVGQMRASLRAARLQCRLRWKPQRRRCRRSSFLPWPLCCMSALAVAHAWRASQRVPEVAVR